MANLTKNQEAAIEHNQGDILVSASAGSGKTHVMISRIVRLVLDKKTSVDRILATTFTEAAALEMKEKLKKALIDKVLETGDKELAKQIPLVSLADVSTIHGFCSKLIRSYFYAAGLVPDFKILADGDDKEYIKFALNKTFDEFYESKDEDFLNMVKKFSSRDDSDGKKEVLKAYYFCSEEIDFNAILDKSLDNCTEENYENIYIKEQEKFVSELTPLIAEMQALLDELQNCNVPKLLSALSELLTFTEQAVASKDLFALEDYKSYALGSRGEKKDIRAEVSALMSAVINKIGAFVMPCANLEEYRAERVGVYEFVKAFSGVVKRFNENYSAVKREENVLDFSDLQRFALAVLQDENILKEVSEKYDFIFIDEYQDVNAIQDEIINLLDRDNAFMVGDDKQCIYAFRGSRSELFSLKQTEFEKENKKTVRLDDNFRSASAVIYAVNVVFNHCMTKERYGQKYPELIFGKLFPEGYGGRFAVHPVSQPKREKDETLLETPRVYDVLNELAVKEIESERVTVLETVNIINEELSKTYYDVKEKKERPITFNDIVILVSKFNTVETQALIKGLTKRGIPVLTKEEDDIVNYPEVATLVNALSAVDCMLQDVPLANTLKSVIGKFTDEDLYSICSFSYPELNKMAKEEGTEKKKSNFWQAYLYYIENAKTPLCDRLKVFNEKFIKLRELADYLTASEVLEKIILDSDYIASVYGAAYGDAKYRRVQAFVDYVNSFGAVSVHAFLERLKLNKGNITMPAAENVNAVRVMTMHKSKGLEFPVVIVYSLNDNLVGKEDNLFVYDRDEGLACAAYNEAERFKRDTLVRKKIKDKIKSDQIKERMRLLYVALTRATYSLHLVYKANKKQREDGEIKTFVDLLPPQFSDYSLPVDSGVLDVQTEVRKVLIGESDDNLKERIEKALNFNYPFVADISLPLKSSASKAMQDREEYYKSERVFTEEYGGQSKEDGVTAHKILELYDFNSPSDIYLQVQKLIDGKVLTAAAVETLDLDKIQNAIGAFKGLIKDKTIYREKQFLAGVPANVLFGGENQSEVLVQGAIDLLAVDDNSAIVIDYKYSSKSVEALIEKYKRQLELYSYVVTNVLGLKVESKKIVSLLTGTVIEI